MKPLTPTQAALIRATDDYNALQDMTGMQINALRRWGNYESYITDVEFLENEIKRLTEKLQIEKQLQNG